mmetsp:Transcript_91564/g.263514  ORF Transcript_91564/g.263514 Transcript_91564/m.263514 type:complete len:201 (-) Transcript_91564:430-1032(-)
MIGLMVEIRGHREGAEVVLGRAEVRDHVGPGLVGKGSAFPITKILLQDGLFGKDDVGDVDHLLVGHGGAGMGGKGGEIFNCVEDDVDRLGDVEMEGVDLCFLGLDLLGSELSIGGEQVGHQVANTGGVLAGSTVEKSTEVDGVNGINDLGEESFFGGLAKVKLVVACRPNVASCIDDRSRSCWRCKRTRIGRGNPCNGWL